MALPISYPTPNDGWVTSATKAEKKQESTSGENDDTHWLGGKNCIWLKQARSQRVIGIQFVSSTYHQILATTPCLGHG